jgi:RND family efflux transporter MFP subunit
MIANQPPAASPRARTRTMIGIAIGIVAFFLILLTVGIVPRLRSSRELAATTEDVRKAVTAVNVVRPQAAPTSGLTLVATTLPIQDSVIYARTSGYLTRRLVDIGDRVQAGQLLAEIESPEIVQQLRQARADLQQAERTVDLQKASRDLARVTMDRYKAADAERAVAVEAVDQSVATYRTAEAAVAAAEATVESNRANVQRLVELTSFQRVVAPFSGTIIQRNVDVGALITAGSPTNNTAAAPSNLSGSPNGLFEIARIDTLRVFVNVPQAFAPNVRAGQPATVSVRGHLDAPVAATVTRTASALDPATRTLLTQVDIPNRSGGLLPGMFVSVDFQLTASGTRWRVPATAVIVDAQGNRVATVAAGNAIHFQPVQLGRDLGDSFEVQAGLQGDEAIVVQPTVSLKEGQVVKPIASPSAS